MEVLFFIFWRGGRGITWNGYCKEDILGCKKKLLEELRKECINGREGLAWGIYQIVLYKNRGYFIVSAGSLDKAFMHLHQGTDISDREGKVAQK